MESSIDANWTNEDYEIKEQDRFLPIANVGRVMKKALPDHAKLSKESKVCIQECVSEFISFVTSQAVDRCNIEKRKTLNGEDILWALYTLGFESYSETLKIYLAKYREFEQKEAEKRPPRKASRKRAKQATHEPEPDYDSEDFLSEDISPGNSDSSLSRHVTREAYMKTPAGNMEVTNGADFKYDFNDPTFVNFNMNQRSNSMNYLLMPSRRQSSIKAEGETDLPNFEEFVDRIEQ